MIDRTDAGDEGGNVPQTVLDIEHNRGKSFARHGFRNDGRAEHAPAGTNGVTRAQAPGEGEGRLSHANLQLSFWGATVANELRHQKQFRGR
jgi:hypothetical protein